MKHSIRIPSFIMSTARLLSASGGYATWLYCGNPASADGALSLPNAENLGFVVEGISDGDDIVSYCLNG